MVDSTTAAGQERWRQRIRKENAVNGIIKRDGFSVRNAVSSQHVPMLFKPGHMDPSSHSTEVGFDPASTLGKEFRKALSTQVSSPRQRILFPETSNHDIGWLLKEPGGILPRSERGTMAGLSPRAGLGWLKPSDGKAVQPPQPHVPLEKSQARLGQAGSSGSRQGGKASRDATLPGTIGHSGDDRPLRISEATDPALDQVRRGGATVAADGSAEHRPISKMFESVKRRACGQKAQERKLRTAARVQVSEPPASPKPGRHEKEEVVRLRRDPDPWGAPSSFSVMPRPKTSQEDAVDSATDRSRRFLNGQGSRWYKPKGSSDVANFADAYTRSWGIGLFCRVGNK